MRAIGGLTGVVLLTSLTMAGCLGGTGEDLRAVTGYGLVFAESVPEPLVMTFEGDYDAVDSTLRWLPTPLLGDSFIARIEISEWLPAGVPLDVHVRAVDADGEPLAVFLGADRSRVYHQQSMDDGFTVRMSRAEGQEVTLSVHDGGRSLHELPEGGAYEVTLQVVAYGDRLVPRVPVEVLLDEDPRLVLDATTGEATVTVWGPQDRVVFREHFRFDPEEDSSAIVDLRGHPAGNYVLATRGNTDVTVEGLAAPKGRILSLYAEAGEVHVVEDASTVWVEEGERTPWSVSVAMWFPVVVTAPFWRVEQDGSEVRQIDRNSIMTSSGPVRQAPSVSAMLELADAPFTFTFTRSQGNGEVWAVYTFFER